MLNFVRALVIFVILFHISDYPVQASTVAFAEGKAYSKRKVERDAFSIWWEGLSELDRQDVTKALVWFGYTSMDLGFYDRLSERGLWPPPFEDNESVLCVSWNGDFYIAIRDRSAYEAYPMRFLVQPTAGLTTAFGSWYDDELLRHLMSALDEANQQSWGQDFIARNFNSDYWFEAEKLSETLEKLAVEQGYPQGFEFHRAETMLSPDRTSFHYVFIRTKTGCLPPAYKYPLSDVVTLHVFTPGFFLQDKKQLREFFKPYSARGPINLG